MRFPEHGRTLRARYKHTDGGDVSVHCMASSEEVVTLIFVVAYRWGLGLVGGDVNVHCIVSSEDVVTLVFVVAYRWGWGDVNFHCIAS